MPSLLGHEVQGQLMQPLPLRPTEEVLDLKALKAPHAQTR